MERATVTVKQLRLGDTVRLQGGGSYMDAIVKRIDENGVTVERPYMAHADFATGGVKGHNSVIVWIGHEDVTYRLDSSARFELVRSTSLSKKELEETSA